VGARSSSFERRQLPFIYKWVAAMAEVQDSVPTQGTEHFED